MKKILVVLGGGRPRGNTMQLVESFMKGASDAGHLQEVYEFGRKIYGEDGQRSF